MDLTLEQIKEKIEPILRKNDVIRSSIFGSYARGDQNKDSDVDILIEYGKPKGLFDHIGLAHELEDELGAKVDLLTYDSIYEPLKKYIYQNEVKIYG